jgi:hypothetical protein
MQIDAVKHHLVPERLPQPDRRDGWLGGVGNHAVSVQATGFTAASAAGVLIGNTASRSAAHAQPAEVKRRFRESA